MSGRCARLLLGTLLVIRASPARAGNDDSILLGNEAALMAGAVVATTNDGSALWYNPAGLSGATRDSVDVAASAFTLRNYRLEGLLRDPVSGDRDASSNEIVTIPSALTYVRRFSPRMVAGAGLFASQVNEYVLRTSLSVPDAASGALGREQRLMSAELARYHLVGGFAVELPRGVSVGFSLSGDYQEIGWSERYASDVSVEQRAVFINQQSVVAEQALFGFHARAGVAYRPLPTLRFGLSIESPGFYFRRKTRVSLLQSVGDLTELSDEPGAWPLRSTLIDTTERDKSVGLYAPVRVRFGGALAVAGGSIALEGDLSSRARDSGSGLDRELGWNVRAGAAFPVSEHLRLGAGFFTDRGAERKDALGAGREHFYGATLGGQYESVRRLAEDPAHPSASSTLTFSSTLALRYAYGSGKLGSQDVQLVGADAERRAVPIETHELTVHIGSGLYF